MLAGPTYSSAYAASSPTVSRSSPQPSPPIRVPRYLRRYTICAATNSTQWQHRPTSPLANSFTPDDYHHAPSWVRRRSDSFSPKVNHYPSASAFPASLSTPVLSRAQSLVTPATHHNQPPANHIFLRPSSTCSVSSLMTDCSFHTAYDPSEPPIDSSTIDHLKNDSSDSSTSRGAQSSSDDTVVSPSDPPTHVKKENSDEEDDLEEETKHGGEWPAPFLMTITRQDLDKYDKQQLEKQQQQQQQHKRTFTWGRKHGRKSTNDSQEIITTIVRTKSRKLKKKRPDSLFIIDDQEPFQARILSIYTQDDLEEFDPLKHLPTSSPPSPEEPPPPDTDTLIPSSPQNIGIPISSDEDDIPHIDAHPTILSVNDEWEDVDSSDPHHDYQCIPPSSSSDHDDDDDDDDSAPPPERIRSRTPQEILQGLDVVHEEEEEEDSIKAEEDPTDHLEKRQSYPYIKNKGKQRQESNDDDDEEEEEDIHHREETIDEEEEDQPVVIVPPLNDIDTDPVSENQPEAQPSKDHNQTPSSPRRKKLSKRRQSRRALDHDSPPPPPLPERNPTTTKSKSKSEMRTKPSRPALRPRRTNSFISHVFRPFTSFALLLGIDISTNNNNNTRIRSIRGNKKRLSRELRTPNALLLGRHFSEKHIPRFPSRLDGKRTVDKKIVKYE